MVSWGDEDGPYMAIPICLNQSETAAAVSSQHCTEDNIAKPRYWHGPGRGAGSIYKCEV